MPSLRSLLLALTACPWASTTHVAASSEASCVFVSNDHGDALQEWLRATADAGGPLAVLHIDAHNDLNVPDADSRVLTSPAAPAELRRRWQLNGTLASELAAAVDLANFQLAAVRAGVVDRIIWVRQSSLGDSSHVLHTVHSLRLKDGGFEDEEVYSSALYDAAHAHILRPKRGRASDSSDDS